MKRTIAITFLFAVLLTASPLLAVNIDMVTVGNPGNAPDTRYNNIQVGAVNYVYRIGKYEITAGQYTEFLNAVAKDDPNGLYHPSMGPPGGCCSANIERSGSSPNYSYSVATDWADLPNPNVSLWNAARFANWMHNGQPIGAQGPNTTESGAYHDVGNSSIFGRSPGAKFFIPNEDEWYKAAYHDKTAGLAATYFDYPTGTNSMPGRDTTESTNPGNNANYNDRSGLWFVPYYRTRVGEFELSASPYGTFDQGGNWSEWTDTRYSSLTWVVRGGEWHTAANQMHAVYRLNFAAVSISGSFRIAASVPIPEPSCVALFAVAAVMVGSCRIRMLRP